MHSELYSRHSSQLLASPTMGVLPLDHEPAKQPSNSTAIAPQLLPVVAMTPSAQSMRSVSTDSARSSAEFYYSSPGEDSDRDDDESNLQQQQQEQKQTAESRPGTSDSLDFEPGHEEAAYTWKHPAMGLVRGSSTHSTRTNVDTSVSPVRSNRSSLCRRSTIRKSSGGSILSHHHHSRSLSADLDNDENEYGAWQNEVDDTVPLNQSPRVQLARRTRAQQARARALGGNGGAGAALSGSVRQQHKTSDSISRARKHFSWCTVGTSSGCGDGSRFADFDAASYEARRRYFGLGQNTPAAATDKDSAHQQETHDQDQQQQSDLYDRVRAQLGLDLAAANLEQVLGSGHDRGDDQTDDQKVDGQAVLADMWAMRGQGYFEHTTTIAH